MIQPDEHPDERPEERPEERIAAMLAAGNISPSEAKHLLQAIDGKTATPAWMWLIHPFEWFSPARGLGLFAAVFIASVALTRANVAFDGAFDVHRFATALALPRAALQVAVVMALTTVLYWLATRLQGRKVRLVDFATVTAVSRIPLLLMGLSSVVLQPMTPTGGPPIAQLVVALVLLIWLLVLLFRGLRWASGLKGPRLWVVYLGVMVLAEIVSIPLIRSWLA